MMKEFHINLFSHTGYRLYPDNSTSRFTVELPKMVELDGSYVVGLTDIHHPKILGTVTDSAVDQDQICLPFAVSEETFQHDIETFISLLLNHATVPTTYQKRYFYEYLNLKNLREFEVCAAFQKDLVQPSEQPHFFKITPFNIKPEFRLSMVERDYIQLESNRNYTMRQILYIVLNTYLKVLKQEQNNFGIVVEKGRTIGEMLLLYAETFVNTLQGLLSNYQTAGKTSYLLLYCDLVAPTIVGDELARLLYVAPRQSDVERDVLEIRNVKYFPVNKRIITSISFFFADELGRQIMFESGLTPVYIGLTFRKVV